MASEESHALNIGLVVPAAGSGHRLGNQGPKALVAVAGVPLLQWTLRRFVGLHGLSHVVIAAPEGFLAETRSIALSLDWGASQVDVVAGGSTRQDSVRRALEVLHRDVSIVIVHDAARPLVALETIWAVVDAASRVGASTAAARPSDSMRRDTADRRQTKPVDRSQFWLVETPQAFWSPLIRKAHSIAAVCGHSATDDASLVEQCGLGNVELVESRGRNLKVTTAEDLDLAALVLSRGSIVSA